MIEFGPHDFVPLAEFSLRWRWTESTGNTLPPRALARIRALSAARAADLAPHVAYLCDERRELAREMRTDGEPARVSAWLRTLHIEPSTRLVVSWDAATAVVTDWELFCSYWDDFCYPASDNVTILPLSEEWVLCYDHHELFRLDHPDHAV